MVVLQGLGALKNKGHSPEGHDGPGQCIHELQDGVIRDCARASTLELPGLISGLTGSQGLGEAGGTSG